mgnify:CR=1 FL=1
MVSTEAGLELFIYKCVLQIKNNMKEMLIIYKHSSGFSLQMEYDCLNFNCKQVSIHIVLQNIVCSKQMAHPIYKTYFI